MKKIKFALVVAVFGFGLVVSLFPVTNAFAGGDDNRKRLECKSFGPNVDTSLDARYEARDGRQKLSISFEAGLASGISEGSLPIAVGTWMGTIELENVVNGVAGDLNFDTNPEDDEAFPDTIGEINNTTVIIAGGLKCPLE